MSYTILTKEEFAAIKDDREFTINLIKDKIINEKLPLPIEKPTQEKAFSEFMRLSENDYKPLLKTGEWFSRYEYKYAFTDKYIDLNYDGLEAADYFTFDARMVCDSVNSPSPKRVWENEKFLTTLLGSIYSLKQEEVNSKTLRTNIQLRKYIASQFRPSAAKCLYQIFNAKKVLDFSGGWGDRLVAALATDSVRSYSSIDPNKAVFDQYKYIDSCYNHTSKKTCFVNGCAEDVVYRDVIHGNKNLFDFVFTSPPYFNIEKYDKSENQSYIKFNKLDAWLEGFLFKSISNFWGSLEVGGTLAINISDVYSNHRIHNICDPMNDFISSLEGAEYQGAIGYRMHKRLNSKSDKTGTFCEPIWCFKKN